MLSPQVAAPTRRTSVPTVREPRARRVDWVMVLVWAVGLPFLSAAGWAGVWWLCRLLAGLPR